MTDGDPLVTRLGMDSALRAEAKKLRDMGSELATLHLIKHWPKSYRPTFILIQHLSWKIADQMRLAEHFLPRKPCAAAFPYEAFASFMSVQNFLAAIDRVWPDDRNDRDLLMYHLGPTLDKYPASDAGEPLVQAFVESHR
jgi:hypothetical protein